MKTQTSDSPRPTTPASPNPGSARAMVPPPPPKPRSPQDGPAARTGETPRRNDPPAATTSQERSPRQENL